MVARGTGRRRLLLAGAAALLAPAIGLGAWLAAGAGESRSAAPGAIRGLRAELVDREAPRPRGGVAWTTDWRLCWSGVPGARGYLVTLVTAEGVDPRPRATGRTCYGMTVASGTAGRAGRRPGRSSQLALIESLLSVSVAARMPDGSIGAATADMPVGREHP